MTKVYSEGKINPKDLYFGCMNYDFNKKKMVQRNLFSSMRVLRSIAIYRTRKEELEQDSWLGEFDPLRFCFGDLWGHVEYEMQVAGMFNKDDTWEKMSLWDMYVKPNAEYLMSLVNSVSIASCQDFLEEYHERTGR